MSTDILPKALTALIDDFGNLPGVGPRTAERYAYAVLRRDPKSAKQLARSLDRLHDHVKTCPKTFALIDASDDVSPLYADQGRNRQLVCVVEEPLDIIALERTKQFTGTYHVLGGVISPIDNIGPEQLHIPELIERIKTDDVQEIIIATNASVEGESTALFLQRYIQEAGLGTTITRLARGIPVGVDLEYADQITLTHALEGRKKL
ncbi:recombinase RecR [Candidatus Nanosynbacter lyticus]|jgi:recombination protein recR|uniref:Recombination protein RecR n=1 Tax=Candidatus Nanosynbacter lyticus TaxID=2093824 RepID=A0A6S4GQQ0_9BACT|nr:recombination mediator RecR [Candidatus Nanosynbacter lyticus]AJA06422.1 recombinase RecR [Candidatus Nanosynbacter lyticus]QCT41464.1 recombination protein RecR [TM7 phylum sp. oral taxon 952]